jgi:hypothetical protein
MPDMVVAILRVVFLCVFTQSMALVGLAQQGGLVEGEVLVKLAARTVEADRKALEAEHGLSLVRYHASIDIYHYRSDTEDVWTLVAKLRSSPFVFFAEPNYVRQRQSAPNDEFYKFQWYLPHIDWEKARAAFTGTTLVTVAVIDSGVSKSHSHLQGYLTSNGEFDYVKNNRNANDESGHGTLVAGIITGRTNDRKGVAGITPTARILPIRVFDNAGFIADGATVDVSVLVAALDRARTHGARIINLSLGGPLYSFAERLALSSCDAAGILLVCAAGNGDSFGLGVSNDNVPVYPAGYNIPGIISVAATDEENRLALFSNYGVRSVHLAAPGQFMVGCDVPRRTLYAWDFRFGWQGWTESVARGHGWTWDYYLGQLCLVTSGPWPYYAAPYLPRSRMTLLSPRMDLRNQTGARLEIGVIGRLGLDDYLTFSTRRSNERDGVFGGVLLYPGWTYDELHRDISRLDGSIGNVDIHLVADFGGWGTYSSGTLGIDFVAVTVLDRSSLATEAIWYADGTSFAAPVVSGVAAMMMSQNPRLSHLEVRQALLDTATPASALAGKIATGAVVNAQAALAAAMPRLSPADQEPPIIAVAAPAESVTSTRSTSFTLRGTARDNVRPTRLEYRVQPPGGNYTKWVRGTLTGSGKNRSWSQTVELPAEGSWRVQVRVADAAGNRSAAATRTLVVDRTRPTVAVTSPTTASTPIRTARFTLRGTATDDRAPDVLEYRVQRPGGSYTKWQRGTLTGTKKTRSWSQAVEVPVEGLWRVQVRAVDGAGNRSAAVTRTAVVDRTAPTVVVSSPRRDTVSTSRVRYNLEGTASDNVTAVRLDFRVRPPGGSYGKWEASHLSGSAAGKSWARQVRVNALGEWRVQIRAADRAGNVSAARTITINRL